MSRVLMLIAFVLAAAFLLPPSAPATADRPEGDGVEAAAPVLWYFWREDCPYCRRAETWLDDLKAAHPELVVRRVEVVRDAEGRALFVEMMRARGERASAVPTFILDEVVRVGFTPQLAEDLAAEVAARLEGEARAPSRARTTLDLGPLGTVDVGARPMAAATLLIAFVDGFNPCSLWVLTVLIAMVLGTRSRARIAAVGMTFLLVTATIYGLFITGLFAAVVVAGHLGWITVAVAILALLFGLVNVKDYFAFKWGLSFTIPDRFKPGIYRGGRKVREDRPLLATLGITVALAAGVALIELPCTAGFPVIWTTLISEAGVSGGAFAGLLALYLAVYLSVELAILATAVITLRASRMQDAHGRTLKLFGGMVMIALAGVLLVDPTIMERLSGSLVVIAGAVAASVLVMLVDRWRKAR
jgi:cytochrome c biogenesis protein CcdA/glutaredoxin